METKRGISMGTSKIRSYAVDDPSGAEAEVPRLGGLIRRHRTRMGLTQQGLADLTTISVRVIRGLERDRVHKPRGETVRLIAEGLRLGPRSREALHSAARRGVRGAFSGGALTLPMALQPIYGPDTETAAVADELLAVRGGASPGPLRYLSWPSGAAGGARQRQ